ncbi:MAG: hypothetical protein IJQ28_05770 [Clostridia bacterium]|nr:hypothetical protein [Clostridia bacterium]MBQ6907869.1 hypothetical protein [Clostridia bacterium]
MNKNDIRIIVSAIIAAIVVSLLFFIADITNVFVTDYIFALIAITGIAVSLICFNKNDITKPPQGLSFIYTAVIYGVVNVIFSIIAYYVPLSVKITIIAHVAILAVFAIRSMALISGSEYINKVDEKAEIKHRGIVKEKESYWK